MSEEIGEEATDYVWWIGAAFGLGLVFLILMWYVLSVQRISLRSKVVANNQYCLFFPSMRTLLPLMDYVCWIHIFATYDE